MAARSGWLIVDEAFMDATPEFSLIPYSREAGVVVLRSIGKFFGLAGLRAGVGTMAGIGSCAVY